MPVPGEAAELNGLVDSLRARCPVLDEPWRCEDVLGAAAYCQDEPGYDKTPSEAFKAVKQVVLTVQYYIWRQNVHQVPEPTLEHKHNY